MIWYLISFFKYCAFLFNCSISIYYWLISELWSDSSCWLLLSSIAGSELVGDLRAAVGLRFLPPWSFFKRFLQRRLFHFKSMSLLTSWASSGIYLLMTEDRVPALWLPARPTSSGISCLTSGGVCPCSRGTGELSRWY